MSETYKFMKCLNKECGKRFASMSEEVLRNAAETHMMKTGHIVVEWNGED